MSGSANTQAASTVKISKTNISLVKTQKYKLAVKGTSQKVKWSSSKPTVATVNSQGIVNAKKKGNTVITAFVNNKMYRCKVTVEEPKFNRKSVEIPYRGVTYLSINSAKKISKCKSSNPDIVTAYIGLAGEIIVSAMGEFGSTTITGYIGDYQMKCTVTIKDPKFSKSTFCLGVLNSEVSDLYFGKAPENVEFYVEDPTIATIRTTYSSNFSWTIDITGEKTGTTFIVAKCVGKTYKCKIIADEPSLSVDEDIAIAHGDSYQLEMKNTVRKCSFSSSNNVVSVNSRGLISGDVCGHSTIKVKLSPSEYTEDYYIDVYVCMPCEMYAGYARLLLQQGVYKNCKSFTINGLYDAMDLTQRIVNGVKMDYTVITADGATITDSVLISETRQIAKNGYTLITNDNIIGNINVQKFKPQNLVYISSFLGNKEYVNKVFWHKIRNDFKAKNFYGNQL